MNNEKELVNEVIKEFKSWQEQEIDYLQTEHDHFVRVTIEQEMGSDERPTPPKDVIVYEYGDYFEYLKEHHTIKNSKDMDFDDFLNSESSTNEDYNWRYKKSYHSYLETCILDQADWEEDEEFNEDNDDNFDEINEIRMSLAEDIFIAAKFFMTQSIKNEKIQCS